jgi:Fe-S-cluster-containing dehydrogenase component
MKDDPKNVSRRSFIRFALYNTAGICVGSLMAFGKFEDEPIPQMAKNLSKFDWGFVIDTTRCIGCGSCVRACKIENKVPDSYFRTWVERYEIDEDEKVHVDSPNGSLESFKKNHVQDKHVQDKRVVKGFFVPKLCNHCQNSSCTQVCPVGATFHSPDGVVLIDKKHCIGCGYCVQACPYGCRYISHPPGTADKCTLCYHRIHQGFPTACVYACPRQARLFGNLKDPDSQIRKILHKRRYYFLKPELATNPKCFYIGLDMEVK